MADVAADLKSWSTTASSNSPAGSTSISTGLDDNLREIQKVVRQDLAYKGADVASTATPDVGAVAGFMHDITGTTTITGLGTVSAGIHKVLKFEGALTLTHNATSLILPGAANITTADGDVGWFLSEGAGNWRCLHYMKASGAPLKMSPITNSLGADVALNNTANYFDGPSVAQGTTGVWFVSGTVTVTDGGTGEILAKLWDGTTVIASTMLRMGGAGNEYTISLSGYIANPAGNLRISCKDNVSTSSLIVYNTTSESKDSTITAIRIA